MKPQEQRVRKVNEKGEGWQKARKAKDQMRAEQKIL